MRCQFSHHIKTRSKILKERASKLGDKSKRENYWWWSFPPAPPQKRNFRWVKIEPPNRFRNLRAENFLQPHLMSPMTGSTPCRAEWRLACSLRKKPQHSCPATTLPQYLSAKNGMGEHQKVFPNPNKGTELSETAPVDRTGNLP